MKDIIIQALVDRIKVGMMVLEEVPEVYKEEVQKLITIPLNTSEELNGS